MNKNRKILTLTAAFGFATLAVHGINKIISISATINHLLDHSEERTYDWKFGKIAYSKKGSGSPVLLVHDVMPGASGYEWKSIEDTLSSSHTVYTIDLLGCGHSEKPGITYTNYLYVQLLADFVKNVIGEKTDIVASHFSGSFTLMACLIEKELFGKVILVNPCSLSSLKKMPSRKDRFLRSFLEAPVFGTLIYNMIISKENTSSLFMDKLYYNPFSVTQDLIDTYYEAAHYGGCYSKYLYCCSLSKYLNANVDHALKTIENPVYIITGQDSQNISVAEEYVSLNETIETFQILHTKMVPHLEIPEAFTDIVGDILDND